MHLYKFAIFASIQKFTETHLIVCSAIPQSGPETPKMSLDTAHSSELGICFAAADIAEFFNIFWEITMCQAPGYENICSFFKEVKLWNRGAPCKLRFHYWRILNSQPPFCHLIVTKTTGSNFSPPSPITQLFLDLGSLVFMSPPPREDPDACIDQKQLVRTEGSSTCPASMQGSFWCLSVTSTRPWKWSKSRSDMNGNNCC